MDKQEMLQLLADHADYYFKLSDQIWDTPEVRFTEYRSSKVLAEALRQEGFSVEWGLAGINTAFQCIWGAGKPVIGFLGEFDALPNLSQQADIAEKRPIVPEGNGHGCGHNLLGVGSLIGAIGTKLYLNGPNWA